MLTLQRILSALQAMTGSMAILSLLGTVIYLLRNEELWFIFLISLIANLFVFCMGFLGRWYLNKLNEQGAEIEARIKAKKSNDEITSDRK